MQPSEDSKHPQSGSDTGPWALVPEWVLELPVSDKAIRLYAVLGRYADSDGKAWPSRKTLAERLGCSVKSIDRANRELVAAKALLIEARRDEQQGDPMSNLYYVLRARPGGRNDAAPGSPTDDPRGRAVPDPRGRVMDGPRTRTSRNENQLERIETERARLWKVDRKVVKHEHEQLAGQILREWNLAAGQQLMSVEWLAKIVMRIREHPELTLPDHTHIIHASLANPWWSGNPSPAVIYGNGSVFEQQMNEARNPKRRKAGLTPEEIRSFPDDEL